MDKVEMKIVRDVVAGWKAEIDKFAGNYISTKYSRLQDEINEMVMYFDQKMEEME